MIVGCFAVGMVLTPPDVFSQSLLAVPMWLLFEAGVICGSMIRKREEHFRGDAEDDVRHPATSLPHHAREPAAAEEGDFVAADRVRLRDRRLTHMRDVHRVEVNESLRVGRLGGQMGNGRLLRLDATEAELQVSFDQPPPASCR